jgi:hypothetical protein
VRAADGAPMPKRSSTSRDVNVTAFNVVQKATAETQETPAPEKNPAAVALGRMGGLKGGRARAEKLTSEKRREIAQKAAASRWSRNEP